MKQNPYQHHKSTNAPKILGLIILLVFVFALGWNVGAGQTRQATGSFPIDKQSTQISSSSDKVDMQLFWDVWGLLASKYVDPTVLDYKNMIYGAIRGMVNSLGDPYTAFLTPKENKDFQESMNGTLEGIGAELTLRDGVITVVSPLKGSPAKNAGLEPEDVILKVNGEDITDFSLEQVVMKIRGPKGTKVKLTIGRKGQGEPFDVDILRDTININSVDWKMIGNIADIELNQFGAKTNDEFTKAISGIQQKSPKGIILDLRYNGGGYLDGAVDITSEFVEKGKVVSVKKRNPDDDEVIYVTGKAQMATVPMVVLINKGSASASEIVAGAIHDNQRGTIMGETSFGKGTVQEVENLVDGSSLRVTIAKWYTPNNVNISKVGITPDIEVKRTIEDMKANKDPQLDAAVAYLKKQ
jgi:carboxyl-terminal processing protease